MSEKAEIDDKSGFDSEKFSYCDPDLPLGREMPGSFVQFNVTDVEEAIALAKRFRETGKYRYFRGQRDATWGVTSSFARLDAAGRRKAQEDIYAFAEWVYGAERLVPYLTDDDKIIAAAQHHQVTSTIFIDFSTDPSVAGWFATESGAIGQDGAIYLVNPDAVSRLFEEVTGSELMLRFLQVDVPNLWRLQAQSGLFLEAQCDIALIWPFDRIVFPQTGAVPAIERRRIYPDHRSHLEQMIDDYRSQIAHESSFRNLKETLLRRGAFHVKIESPHGDLIPVLDSTPLEVGWSKGPDERWGAVDVDSRPPFWSIEHLKENHRELIELIAARRTCVDLLTVTPNLPRRDGTVQAAVACVWEGMRPHPYSAEQIATSISSLIQLLDAWGDLNLGDGKCHRQVAEQLLVDPVEIEMGMASGSVARAFVSSSDLWRALSEKARSSLGLEQAVNGDELMNILGKFYGATLHFFDPHALIGLFASIVVPWQVATKRNPLCFSPVHVKTLGRP
jgi:hypothetical protein